MIVDASIAGPGERDRLDPRRGAPCGNDPAGAARVGAGDRDLALRGHRAGGRGAALAAGIRRASAPRARGLAIGAAGTHPFARWEDQRVVAADRYRGLIRYLGFVARQELVFGMHVHVGMADPEETIQVANGMRAVHPAADRPVCELAASGGGRRPG